MKVLFMPEMGDSEAVQSMESVSQLAHKLVAELMKGISAKDALQIVNVLMREYRGMFITLFSSPLTITFNEDNSYSISHHYGTLLSFTIVPSSWADIDGLNNLEDVFDYHVTDVLEKYHNLAVGSKEDNNKMSMFAPGEIFPNAPKEAIEMFGEVVLRFRLHLIKELFPTIYKRLATDIRPQVKIVADFLRGLDKS
ncbi:MAG: hypothetical protein ACRDBQ_18125 [Shewanella sp.]